MKTIPMFPISEATDERAAAMPRRPWTGRVAFALLWVVFILLMLLMGGCSTLDGLLVKRTVVEARPAQTNIVERVVTNTVESVVYVTNLVEVARATNAAGQVQAVLEPQVLPQRTVQEIVLTNRQEVVTPAVLVTNLALSGAVAGGVRMAGEVAPFPFANTIASGLLAASTLVFGFLNKRNAAKAVGAVTALDQAKLVAETLVDNVETIRKAALTVPGYAAKDAEVMKVVQKIQRAAGVKDDVAKLVEEHTDETKPA